MLLVTETISVSITKYEVLFAVSIMRNKSMYESGKKYSFK